MDYTMLSQRDAKWAKIKLGFSNYTIGSHGCTITALTMWLNRVFGYKLTPDEVNTRLKGAKAFTGALILWARVPVAFPSLTWIFRGYNYDNIRVAFYVYMKRLPVLVEVNAAKIGAAKHWVLYIGGQKACDPWTGKVIPTSTYPATGYALFEKR